MRHNLICVTLDTDADGQNGRVPDRRSLKWEALSIGDRLLEELALTASRTGGPVPMTWFVRADGQLRDRLGDPLYLFKKFRKLWDRAKTQGHEIAWHPHLYRQKTEAEEPKILSGEAEAVEELEGLWRSIERFGWHPKVFRNGEGWQSNGVLKLVEEMGFECDSTALPGLVAASGHPMNWKGAPNHPYYPADEDYRQAGPERSLLEIPMNTWMVKASYDKEPKLRYMNPAAQPEIFGATVDNWVRAGIDQGTDLAVWSLVCHADEVAPSAQPDLMFARSPEAFGKNLRAFFDGLRRAGQKAEFTTLSDAARRWRAHAQHLRKAG